MRWEVRMHNRQNLSKIRYFWDKLFIFQRIGIEQTRNDHMATKKSSLSEVRESWYFLFLFIKKKKKFMCVIHQYMLEIKICTPKLIIHVLCQDVLYPKIYSNSFFFFIQKNKLIFCLNHLFLCYVKHKCWPGIKIFIERCAILKSFLLLLFFLCKHKNIFIL